MKHYDIAVTEQPSEETSRLDKFIASKKEDLSRGLVRQLIERGAVYLNQKRCKQASRPVKVGDSIKVFLPQPREKQAVEVNASNIIFENQDWLIVNKPPFLPTHETVDDSREHLVLKLKQFLAARDGGSPQQVYLGIHHRLDRDTSGVILFTKRKEANAAIAKAFQEKSIQKTYLAVCVGTPQNKHFSIKSFLGRDPKNKRRFKSVQSGGDPAETIVKLLDTKDFADHHLSLVEAKPITGRTHQIRVHLSENHLPIAGDETYGKKLPGIKRLMLHAWKLEVLGKKFEAPLPLEIAKIGFSL